MQKQVLLQHAAESNGPQAQVLGSTEDEICQTESSEAKNTLCDSEDTLRLVERKTQLSCIVAIKYRMAAR